MTPKVYSVKTSLNLMKIQTIPYTRLELLTAYKLQILPLFDMRKKLNFSTNTHKVSFCPTEFLTCNVVQETIQVYHREKGSRMVYNSKPSACFTPSTAKHCLATSSSRQRRELEYSLAKKGLGFKDKSICFQVSCDYTKLN